MKTRILAMLVVGLMLSFNAFSQNQPKPEINTKKSTPVKLIEYIPGTWVIQSVFRGKENVTETDTLAQIETIEFNREGRYMSYSGTEKIDSGAYRLNEQHGLLYLASENKEEKPVEWSVFFAKDGTMTMRMRDASKQMENISYVYKRSEMETSSNRNQQ